MTLLLDTSILIALQRNDRFTFNKLEDLKQLHKGMPVISFISFYEYIHGMREKNIKNKDKSAAFIEDFEVLELYTGNAAIISHLRLTYEKKGKILPLSDLIIASQAILNNMTLLTRDKDFLEIKELKKIII
tara:strand:+ start:4515 stop:4907 length:393 start_codon:yes stop_codon:yes gene_type:complete